MSELQFTTLNAFGTSTNPHSGNPASVIVLPPGSSKANDVKWMLEIAKDFNLSETAYLDPIDLDGEVPQYGIRWFTPAVEAALCGHATLASARVLFHLHPDASTLSLQSQVSGTLSARRISPSADIPRNQAMEISISLPTLPVDVLNNINATYLVGNKDNKDGEAGAKDEYKIKIATALGVREDEIKNIARFGFGDKESLIIEISPSSDLKAIKLDFNRIKDEICGAMMVITQEVENPDDLSKLHIQSRVFCPGLGVDEDPVTGSAHAYLTGYYLLTPVYNRLKCHTKPNPAETVIQAAQLSDRRGELQLSLGEERDGRRMVDIVGKVWETSRGSLTDY